jgi:hypothetical protein
MDRRRIALYAVIGAFMAVTVGHVAAFTGGMEPRGWAWLGWPYALAVDASIAVCAWLTRWATTRRWAWFGYFVFTAASGALNIAQIAPWSQEHPLGAWVYALFPTCAIALLGFLSRDADALAERAAHVRSRADGQASQTIARAMQDAKRNGHKPQMCPHCERTFDSKQALSAHLRFCTARERAQIQGGSDGTVSDLPKAIVGGALGAP